MPCIIAPLSRLILFRPGIAASALNALLTESNHLIRLAFLSHYYVRFGGVARSSLGLVDS